MESDATTHEEVWVELITMGGVDLKIVDFVVLNAERITDVG
jgi:hypothetical protein